MVPRIFLVVIFFNLPETIFCACDNKSVSRSMYVSPWFSPEKKKKNISKWCLCGIWRLWEIILDVCPLTFQYCWVPLCPHFVSERYIAYSKSECEVHDHFNNNLDFVMRMFVFDCHTLLYRLSSLWWR